MNNQDLQTIILNDSPRIVQAITTGSAWEIWMQVELVLILRAAGLQAAREVPYPPPSAQKLDVLCAQQGNAYAIEMKVESANNSGAAIMTALQTDCRKIAGYNVNDLRARWVIGIGYSVPALQAMQALATNQPGHVIFRVSGGIGVIVISV